MMKIAGRAGVILILMAIISISISVSIVSPAMDERTGNRSNASGELASSLLIPPEKINISDAGSIIIDISPRPAEYIPTGAMIWAKGRCAIISRSSMSWGSPRRRVIAAG
jgi:hypothetical protein